MASQDIPSFVLPENYTSPSWPSLGTSTELYLLSDVWLFVTLWTLVMATAIYLMAGVWILVVFGKTRLAWIAVPTFVLFGAVTSLLAGAIIGATRLAAFGAVLAAVYQSGAISMPSEIAVAWGALIACVLTIGSLTKQTFLI